MKKKFSRLMLLMAISLMVASCSEEGKDEAPGLWTALDQIETFPGDTVLVAGQVSNYVGLDKIEITCQAWGINKVYTLDGKHSKVFTYNYRMPVPQDATFDQQLNVTVTDINGLSSSKTLAMTFIPDTEAPKRLTDIPSQISVNYDPLTGTGTYSLDMTVSDDRQLKQASISIADFAINETIELAGRQATVKRDIAINGIGTYAMSITLEDATGNTMTYEHEIISMLAEDEDPIDNYNLMWIVNASESADDYLDGYYLPINHAYDGDNKIPYVYQGKFYADKDGYQFYLTAEKRMDGNLFGTSPYVSSKLMNKQGYVVPITIEKKGYYGLWIDIQNHQWSVWETDASGAYTGSLTVSGCGFKDFGDWGVAAEEMKRDGYRYTYTLNQDGAYTGDRQYYAARVSDWGYALHWWADANGCGWWEDTGGWGGQNGSYVSDYDGKVEIMFDTAILWGSVRKVKN